ncbi:MAG TPA: NADH-quinone oxidoreductase subunit J, partial [Egibacteraceae bacterium]|nr:NADH-quinone oxidoreductase subunit J [Egibacteraceae bacterium]
MTLSDLAMLAIAVVGGAAALLLVTARNVVHAALYLVVALLAVAATFLVMGAEFLAWTQVLIYVGAVVVLILFGLMLTRAPIGPMAQANEQRPLALVVSGLLFAVLVALIMQTFGTVRLPLTHTRTAQLGALLYTRWAFPFMTLGYLLTVALIGAIVIARREEGEGPEPQLDPELRGTRPTPAPSDASASPGVT